MSEKATIITIGRQFGSGGHEIGIALSEKLGFPLYDKEMLKRAAKESGLCEELFETHDEKPTNSFLYSLIMDTYSLGYSSGAYADMPINHKIFLAQFDAIKFLKIPLSSLPRTNCRLVMAETTDKFTYLQQAQKCIADLQSGLFSKVVLSRTICNEYAIISWRKVFQNLLDKNPNAFVFVFHAIFC